MFTDKASPVAPGEACFTSVAAAPTTEHRGAILHTLFPSWMYGNDRIEWCGELRLGEGRSFAPHAYPESEQILLVLEGAGWLSLEDGTAAIGPGSVLYVPAGFTHSVSATRELRLFGARSRIGRVEPPPFLRRGAPSEPRET
jgi:mannose-6-phosphate isomerase-like protein (cupin superfamily)